MEDQSAVIFGATGLTGGHLLNEVISSNHYNRIFIFSRRAISVADRRVTVIEKPLEKITSDDLDILPDNLDVFLCLGTTLSKAGSKEAFKKIDYFLPMKLVNLFKSKTNHFLLISSFGADSDSSSFYLSVKGQLENDLKILDVNKLTIFRPSLLKGKRSEKRLMEGLALNVSRLINPVLSLSFLTKYRPTESEELAKLMFKVATGQIELSNARTNVIPSDMITRLLNP